ncbi:MAG: hypothetical protein ACI9IT_001934 [Glaciecola sp.]|jgi:hypothetical protein
MQLLRLTSHPEQPFKKIINTRGCSCILSEYDNRKVGQIIS